MAEGGGGVLAVLFLVYIASSEVTTLQVVRHKKLLCFYNSKKHSLPPNPRWPFHPFTIAIVALFHSFLALIQATDTIQLIQSKSIHRRIICDISVSSRTPTSHGTVLELLQTNLL